MQLALACTCTRMVPQPGQLEIVSIKMSRKKKFNKINHHHMAPPRQPPASFARPHTWLLTNSSCLEVAGLPNPRVLGGVWLQSVLLPSVGCQGPRKSSNEASSGSTDWCPCTHKPPGPGQPPCLELCALQGTGLHSLLLTPSS